MPKKKATKAIIKSDTPKLKVKAGINQFNSVGMSSNRAYIYGSAVDFSFDYTASDRKEMIKRLRHGERNCGLLRQILNDYVTYVVGDGITVQSTNEEHEAYFNKVIKNIDVTGRFSWVEILRILTRGALRDGDSFLVLTVDESGDPKVQLVEGHKVESPEGSADPNLLDGVQFDSTGKIKSFCFIQSDKKARFIPASSVCHVCEYDYCSGSRGLPLLQHSYADIQSEDELLKLEMLAVRNDADVTRVLKKQGGYISSDMRAELSGSSSSSLDSIASRMGGKLIALETNEDLISLDSKRPNGNFVSFLEAIQKDINRGTGIPYEFSNDPSKAGGGALRLIAGKADRSFQRWQTILIEKVCTKVYQYIIAHGISTGEIKDTPDWWNVSWTTPKRLTIDAGRDAAQDRADVELGLLSMSELYAQRGLDLKTEMAKRAKDMKYIRDLAEAEGIPMWTLYKPAFNWLQEGEGKPTPAEVAMNNLDNNTNNTTP
jgi:capsid protein